jgi:hypothetical protein
VEPNDWRLVSAILYTTAVFLGVWRGFTLYPPMSERTKLFYQAALVMAFVGVAGNIQNWLFDSPVGPFTWLTPVAAFWLVWALWPKEKAEMRIPWLRRNKTD